MASCIVGSCINVLGNIYNYDKAIKSFDKNTDKVIKSCDTNMDKAIDIGSYDTNTDKSIKSFVLFSFTIPVLIAAYKIYNIKKSLKRISHKRNKQIY